MVISGPWKLQKGFSWFQGPETAKKVSFQAPEKAKMSERFFMTETKPKPYQWYEIILFVSLLLCLSDD